MMTPRQQPQTVDFAPALNRIGELEFRFDVNEASRQLGAPEKLLMAVRAELLEVIDSTLTEAASDSNDIRIENLDIDLGAHPDPPDWQHVRATLGQQLLAELTPYLYPRSAPADATTLAVQSQSSTAPSDLLSNTVDPVTRNRTEKPSQDQAADTPGFNNPLTNAHVNAPEFKSVRQTRVDDSTVAAELNTSKQSERLQQAPFPAGSGVHHRDSSRRLIPPSPGQQALGQGAERTDNQPSAIPLVGDISTLLHRLAVGGLDAHVISTLLADLRWRRQNAPARLHEDLIALPLRDLAHLARLVEARSDAKRAAPTGSQAHLPVRKSAKRTDLIAQIKRGLREKDPTASETQHEGPFVQILRSLFPDHGPLQPDPDRIALAARSVRQHLSTSAPSGQSTPYGATETASRDPERLPTTASPDLARMDAKALRELIDELLPTDALQLAAAIERLGDTASDVSEALRVVASALVDGKPIDLERARNAARADLGNKDTARTVIAALLQSVGVSESDISAFIKGRSRRFDGNQGDARSGEQSVATSVPQSGSSSSADRKEPVSYTKTPSGDVSPGQASIDTPANSQKNTQSTPRVSETKDAEDPSLPQPALPRSGDAGNSIGRDPAGHGRGKPEAQPPVAQDAAGAVDEGESYTGSDPFDPHTNEPIAQSGQEIYSPADVTEPGDENDGARSSREDQSTKDDGKNAPATQNLTDPSDLPGGRHLTDPASTGRPSETKAGADETAEASELSSLSNVPNTPPKTPDDGANSTVGSNQSSNAEQRKGGMQDAKAPSRDEEHLPGEPDQPVARDVPPKSGSHAQEPTPVAEPKQDDGTKRSLDTRSHSITPRRSESLGDVTGSGIGSPTNVERRHTDPHVASDMQASERRLADVFAAATPTDAQRLRAMLGLIWSALSQDTGPHRNDQAHFWQAALVGVLSTPQSHGEEENIVSTFLTVIEPDDAARYNLLRILRARLGYGQHGHDPVLRRETCELLDRLLTGDTGLPDRTADPDTDTDFLITTQAGLVIFHPYLPMLFDRLALLTPQKNIQADQMPRAAAVLAALAGVAPQQNVTDPLERLLLAQPNAVELCPDPLSDNDLSIIESLVASVISQWARLGQTSPAALRDAFIRRTGVLQPDADAPRLLVDDGSYDMLLDSLPWALSPVALPWMPAPLTVIWRSRDD